MLRKPRLYRLVHLERSYAGELGRHVTAAMDELCADPRPAQGPSLPSLKTTASTSSLEKREPSPIKVDVKGKGRERVPTPPATEPSKRKVEEDVIELLSSDDETDIEIVSASTSTASSSSSKRNGTATRLPPPKTKCSIFPTPRSTPAPLDPKGKGKAVALSGPPPAPPSLSADVVRALSLDDVPLELSWFCAGVEREDEERLLRTLQMDELRDVARGMKCWKAGVSVGPVAPVATSA